MKICLICLTNLVNLFGELSTVVKPISLCTELKAEVSVWLQTTIFFRASSFLTGIIILFLSKASSQPKDGSLKRNRKVGINSCSYSSVHVRTRSNPVDCGTGINLILIPSTAGLKPQTQRDSSEYFKVVRVVC